MKVINIEKRDVHVELDFTIEELSYLKFLLDQVLTINYDLTESQEKIDYTKNVEEFYTRLTELLKKLEEDFSEAIQS